MKLNLYSVKEHITLLIFILFSFWGNAQTTLVHYAVNGTDNPQAGYDPTLFTGIASPNLVRGTDMVFNTLNTRLRTTATNRYVELTVNTTGKTGLVLQMFISCGIGIGDWVISTNGGSGTVFTEFDRYTVLNLFGANNEGVVNILLPDATMNLPQVKFRITSSIGSIGIGQLANYLEIDDIKITNSNPKILVYSSTDVTIPNGAEASEASNTVFSTLKTLTTSETKTYRVRNWLGSSGSELNVSSIVISPAAGTTAADFALLSTAATGLDAVTVLETCVWIFCTPTEFGTFDIRFTPQGEGVRQATVTVYSNGSPSPYSFTVIGGGRSCGVDNVPYVRNSADNGTHTLPSDLSAADFLGGTAASPSPTGILSSFSPSGNLYSDSPTSWFTKETEKLRTFGGEDGIDISELQKVSVEFRVAAFANDTTNYISSSDYIYLEILYEGNWYRVMRLIGPTSGNRARGRYNFGSFYEFPHTFNTTNISGGSYTNTQHQITNNASRVSSFKLTLPLSISSQMTNFKFRIRAKGNANAVWLIDDIRISYDGSQQTKWNGSTWSAGNPDNEKKAVLSAAYTLNNGDIIQTCACEIETGGSLLMNAGSTLRVNGSIINHNTGDKLMVKDGANIIQIENGAINSGNIQVEKVFNFSSGRQQYNYVISPTVGTNIKSLYTGVIDNNISALYYNQATNYFGVSNGAYIPGRSLAVKEPSTGTNGGHASTPAKFIGVPANGVINYALAYSNNAGGATKSGYNLVGNPYPSNLDLIALYNANNARIMPTFQFWDNRGNLATTQQGNTYGGQSYAKFNALNETGVNATAPASAASPPRTPTRYVSPVQGFIVQALSSANGQNLVFSNTNMRVSNAATQFFGKTAQKTESNRYWLSFITPTDLEYSSAVVYFEGGRNAFGTDDSHASESSDNIYTMADENKISIHGRPIFNGEDVVPLGYTAFAAGSYKIALQNKEGVFNNGQGIYLKDKALNVVTNLTEGAYQFDTQAGDFTGRFEIVYQQETTLLTSNVVKEGLQVFRNGQDFVVRAKSSTIDFIELYDISGRLQQKIKGNQKEVTIPAAYLNNGVYVLKISLNGEWQTRKILK